MGPDPHGQLQGAVAGRRGRRPADERLGQGPEVRTARPCGRRNGTVPVNFSNAILGVHTDDYITVAQAAEAAGFESIALSDHIFYPEKLESKSPYTAAGTPQFTPDESWPDPWVT